MTLDGAFVTVPYYVKRLDQQKQQQQQKSTKEKKNEDLQVISLIRRKW